MQGLLGHSDKILTSVALPHEPHTYGRTIRAMREKKLTSKKQSTPRNSCWRSVHASLVRRDLFEQLEQTEFAGAR